MLIATDTPASLEPEDAAYIAAKLCRQGSEMQAEILAAAADTPMVVIYDEQPIAWVASHQWRGLQTFEAYTLEEYRRRGIARLGLLTLIADQYVDRDQPIAVFRPECVGIARSCGLVDVREFRRDRYGEWVTA